VFFYCKTSGNLFSTQSYTKNTELTAKIIFLRKNITKNLFFVSKCFTFAASNNLQTKNGLDKINFLLRLLGELNYKTITNKMQKV